MQKECSLRLAEINDVPVILKLVKELAHYEDLLEKVTATEQDMKNLLFEQRAGEVVLLEDGPDVVGIAIIFYNLSSFIGKRGIFLEDIFIQEAYRKKGYGKQFLKYIAQLALERDCWGVEWYCLNWNSTSIEFYESLGAKHREEWRIYRLTGDELEAIAAC